VSGVTRERSTSSRVDDLIDEPRQSRRVRVRGWSLSSMIDRRIARVRRRIPSRWGASLRAPTPPSAAPPAATAPPPAPARAGIDPLEHGRVLEHVRDDQESNLAPADVRVLQLIDPTVPTRVRDALQLAVPVVLALQQRSPVRLARLQLDLWREAGGGTGQRGRSGGGWALPQPALGFLARAFRSGKPRGERARAASGNGRRAGSSRGHVPSRCGPPPRAAA
jgi:hypothetical protein